MEPASQAHDAAIDTGEAFDTGWLHARLSSAADASLGLEAGFQVAKMTSRIPDLRGRPEDRVVRRLWRTVAS